MFFNKPPFVLLLFCFFVLFQVTFAENDLVKDLDPHFLTFFDGTETFSRSSNYITLKSSLLLLKELASLWNKQLYDESLLFPNFKGSSLSESIYLENDSTSSSRFVYGLHFSDPNRSHDPKSSKLSFPTSVVKFSFFANQEDHSFSNPFYKEQIFAEIFPFVASRLMDKLKSLNFSEADLLPFRPEEFIETLFLNFSYPNKLYINFILSSKPSKSFFKELRNSFLSYEIRNLKKNTIDEIDSFKGKLTGENRIQLEDDQEFRELVIVQTYPISAKPLTEKNHEANLEKLAASEKSILIEDSNVDKVAHDEAVVELYFQLKNVEKNCDIIDYIRELDKHLNEIATQAAKSLIIAFKNAGLDLEINSNHLNTMINIFENTAEVEIDNDLNYIYLRFSAYHDLESKSRNLSERNQLDLNSAVFDQEINAKTLVEDQQRLESQASVLISSVNVGPCSPAYDNYACDFSNPGENEIDFFINDAAALNFPNFDKFQIEIIFKNSKLNSTDGTFSSHAIHDLWSTDYNLVTEVAKKIAAFKLKNFDISSKILNECTIHSIVSIQQAGKLQIKFTIHFERKHWLISNRHEQDLRKIAPTEADKLIDSIKNKKGSHSSNEASKTENEHELKTSKPKTEAKSIYKELTLITTCNLENCHEKSFGFIRNLINGRSKLDDLSITSESNDASILMIDIFFKKSTHQANELSHGFLKNTWSSHGSLRSNKSVNQNHLWSSDNQTSPQSLFIDSWMEHLHELSVQILQAIEKAIGQLRKLRINPQDAKKLIKDSDLIIYQMPKDDDDRICFSFTFRNLQS